MDNFNYLSNRSKLLVSLCVKRGRSEDNNLKEPLDPVIGTSKNVHSRDQLYEKFPQDNILRNVPEEPSDFDDSDADPDYEPENENKRHKTYFNLQNVFDSHETGFVSLSTKLDLTNAQDSAPAKASSKNIQENVCNSPVLEEESTKNEADILSVCTQVIEDMLDKVCATKDKYKKKSIIDQIHKHPLLPPCNNKCRRGCSKKIDLLERDKIRVAFWTMTFGERRLFLDSHVKQSNVKTRMQEALSSKRNFSLKYFLPVKIVLQEAVDNKTETTSVTEIQTCKNMFLYTLGLKTDGMITTHLRSKRTSDNAIAKTKDDRGLIARSILNDQKLEHESLIINHINCFNPVVSHYNLKHAPNRRYLPSELTISFLWKDFGTNHKIGYDLYRSVFKKQNIGFCRPSQDECEVCTIYEAHSNDANNLKCNCKYCVYYQEHKEHYTEARQAYQADQEKKLDSDERVFSVDMQKVLLLPKMSTKNSFFISRLVVFNETFASLGNGENICVMWHEAIRGRSAADVTSAYYNIMKNLSSKVSKITFWVDNCSAQNKNWTLYSSIICFVNSDWGPNEVTFKYFEPGHSFMAADSVHGRISSQMKKHPNIYDFQQLLNIIEQSSKKTKCLALNISDFFPFTDGCKKRKNNNIPLLDKIKQVQFRKGSKNLFYRNKISNEVYIESDFLKTKFEPNMPSAPRSECIGINTDKKEKILKTLCPLFSDERKKLFWTYLPSNNNSRDLCTVSEV